MSGDGDAELTGIVVDGGSGGSAMSVDMFAFQNAPTDAFEHESPPKKKKKKKKRKKRPVLLDEQPIAGEDEEADEDIAVDLDWFKPTIVPDAEPEIQPEPIESDSEQPVPPPRSVEKKKRRTVMTLDAVTVPETPGGQEGKTEQKELTVEVLEANREYALRHRLSLPEAKYPGDEEEGGEATVIDLFGSIDKVGRISPSKHHKPFTPRGRKSSRSSRRSIAKGSSKFSSQTASVSRADRSQNSTSQFHSENASRHQSRDIRSRDWGQGHVEGGAGFCTEIKEDVKHGDKAVMTAMAFACCCVLMIGGAFLTAFLLNSN